MNEILLQIGLPILTAVLGVWSGNYITKRQKKKYDWEIISTANKTMLETVNNTLNQIKVLTEENIDLKNENMQLKVERNSLNFKIDNLTKKVEGLEQVIRRLSKKKGE
ncbi:MAG: hypothetical protein ACTTJH_00605 [Bacteroidales bacterium]